MIAQGHVIAYALGVITTPVLFYVAMAVVVPWLARRAGGV